MNEPLAADEPIVETEVAQPDLSLNPHLGRLVEPEGDKPEQDAGEDDEKVADSPSDEEGDLDKTEPDDQPKENDDVLRKKVGELAFENRQLKRQLEERQKAEPEAPEQHQPLKTLKDFEYNEQAFNEYLVDETASRTAAKLAAEQREQSGKTEEQKRADAFASREDAFEAESPGFKERLHADDLAISPEMALFIADPESDVGLHVGDYLSQNKAEAARIAALSPPGQFREMAKLETRIGKEVAKAKAEKTRASKAPEPPATIDGTDPGITRNPAKPADADKMSDAEWLKAREKQLAKKRGK